MKWLGIMAALLLAQPALALSEAAEAMKTVFLIAMIWCTPSMLYLAWTLR